MTIKKNTEPGIAKDDIKKYMAFFSEEEQNDIYAAETSEAYSEFSGNKKPPRRDPDKSIKKTRIRKPNNG